MTDEFEPPMEDDSELTEGVGPFLALATVAFLFTVVGILYLGGWIR